MSPSRYRRGGICFAGPEVLRWSWLRTTSTRPQGSTGVPALRPLGAPPTCPLHRLPRSITLLPSLPTLISSPTARVFFLSCKSNYPHVPVYKPKWFLIFPTALGHTLNSAGPEAPSRLASLRNPRDGSAMPSRTQVAGALLTAGPRATRFLAPTRSPRESARL